MPGPQVGGTKMSSPPGISITRVLVSLCHVTEHHRTSRLTAAPRPHPGVLLWVRNPAVAFWLGSPVRLRSPCQPGLPASESCPQETGGLTTWAPPRAAGWSPRTCGPRESEEEAGLPHTTRVMVTL